jgi:hypothetical protein
MMYKLRAGLILSTIFLLSQSLPAAHACSAVSLNNKVGDTIVGFVVFTSSDPNESGEGESMQVTSSGGEINYNLTNPQGRSPGSAGVAVKV